VFGLFGRWANTRGRSEEPPYGPALPDLAGYQECRVRHYRDKKHGHEPGRGISYLGMGRDCVHEAAHLRVHGTEVVKEQEREPEPNGYHARDHQVGDLPPAAQGDSKIAS
jgi:hypothetical protein